jgi:hypothetical protein
VNRAEINDKLCPFKSLSFSKLGGERGLLVMPSSSLVVLMIVPMLARVVRILYDNYLFICKDRHRRNKVIGLVVGAMSVVGTSKKKSTPYKKSA